MKKMKKLLFVLFTAALAVCFSSCSNGNDGEEESVPETYTVTYLDGVNILEIAVPSDSTQYNAGDTVTVKFTDVGARDYYTFAGWTDGTTSYTSGGTTTFTINSNVTLIAQWTCSWPYDYEGTKAATVAKEVGDIVFNDGSAMPYTIFSTLDTADKNTKKAKAIALIFYKGTGLNSDDSEGNAVTTTSRTLGVGLKHGIYSIDYTPYSWCNYSAQAMDINITTIQCQISGSSGAYTFTGDKNGSDNLEQIRAFLTANGRTDDTTGSSAASNYSAFYFGINYKDITGSNVNGTPYETGWYLPSNAELYQIYANGKGVNKIFDIDAASETLGGNKFESSWYESASQEESDNKANCLFNFTSGNEQFSATLKYLYCPFQHEYYYCVCCIREFN